MNCALAESAVRINGSDDPQYILRVIGQLIQLLKITRQTVYSIRCNISSACADLIIEGLLHGLGLIDQKEKAGWI